MCVCCCGSSEIDADYRLMGGQSPLYKIYASSSSNMVANIMHIWTVNHSCKYPLLPPFPSSHTSPTTNPTYSTQTHKQNPHNNQHPHPRQDQRIQTHESRNTRMARAQCGSGEVIELEGVFVSGGGEGGGGTGRRDGAEEFVGVWDAGEREGAARECGEVFWEWAWTTLEGRFW